MCGICGYFSPSGKSLLKKDNLREAMERLSPRGPDSNGHYLSETAALGHSRLAVIDTSEAAAQPFSDPTGRYFLVYNGEIYNYLEHREALLASGQTLTSRSDTEVLLWLLIQQGVKALSKLDGDFSFAFYDSREQTLIIARDRLGIKPLVYFSDGNDLAFASDLQSLLPFHTHPQANPEALALFFRLTYIPAPYTAFRNIFKLMPGHYLKAGKEGITIQQFYNIPECINNDISYPDAVKEVRRLVTEAVGERLVSDVPLGTFLSGGIDSSVVTSVAAQFRKKIHAFTVTFPGSKYYDESPYAKEVATKCGAENILVSVSEEELLENIGHFFDHTAEPFADSSAIAMAALSRKTREFVTVALSGDGADELFGGYNKHQAHFRALYGKNYPLLLNAAGWAAGMAGESRNSKLGNTARKIRKFNSGLRDNPTERYLRWASWMNQDDAASLLQKPWQTEKLSEILVDSISPLTGSGLNEILRNDLRLVLPNDMLFKTDSMSMSAGLEVRVPLLDHQLVDFVASLPGDYKVMKGTGKRILRDAFPDMIPESVLNRPKHGFEVPLGKWFAGPLRSMVDELTQDSFLSSQNVFNPETVRNIRSKALSGAPGDSIYHLWEIIVFQHWWKKYVC